MVAIRMADIPGVTVIQARSRRAVQQPVERVGHVEIEVAAQDAGSRGDLASKGLDMLGAASDQGALGGLLLQVQEPGNLRLPLDCGMKLEVSVDDPDGTETCLHGDFQRNAP